MSGTFSAKHPAGRFAGKGTGHLFPAHYLGGRFCLGLRRRFGCAELERFGLDRLSDRATADALHTDTKCRVLARRQSDVYLLQVRNKLSAGDPSHFRTNAAEVFCLTANFDAVTDLDGFTANFTLPSHRIDLKTEKR